MFLNLTPDDLAPGEVLTVNGNVMDAELAETLGFEVAATYEDAQRERIARMFGK